MDEESTSYSSNNLNQLTQTTVGNNSTSLTYDANGNMTSEGSKTFGYNDADELTSVIVPGQTKSTFEYDPDGRKRISTEYAWQNDAWVKTDETRYVYDGMDLVQERDGQGNVKASYVRDGNIGGILSMTNADGTFDYHYDGNGNVVALTDSNGNIKAEYSYDAYGNLLSSSGSEADKNPFRYSSKYFDSNTGLYDYGARHYDPELGRWINRDPLGEEGGLNLYGFAGNSPGNAVDEYGYKDRSKGLVNAGPSISNYAKYPTKFLFDTDPDPKHNVPRRVYLVPLPSGWQSIPGSTDVDYVRQYGSRKVRWYHLNPLELRPSYYTDKKGNTRLHAIGRPVCTNERTGLHGWLDTHTNHYISSGEWINKKNGLPYRMMGNGNSVFKKLTVEEAKKLGFIQPIQPVQPIQPIQPYFQPYHCP